MNNLLQRPFLFLTLVFISLIGFAVIVILTAKRGMGIIADGPLYIFMARYLFDSGLSQKHLLWHLLQNFPPLYPFSLAVIHWLGGPDPLTGSRWLGALLMGMNIFLVGLLIYRHTQTFWLTMAGGLWMLVDVDILNIHSQAMPEALYLFLTLLWVMFLSDFLATRRWIMLWGCSIAAGLACITRFAGLPLVLTGVVMLLWDSRKADSKSLFSPVFFLVMSMFPMVGWMLKNFWDGGRFVDREFAFHPFLIVNLKAESGLLNHYSHPMINLMILAVVISLGWMIWEKKDPSVIEGVFLQKASFIRLLTIFIFSYILLWAVCVIFFDALATESRYFLPIQILGLLFCLIYVHILLSVAKCPQFLKFCFAAFFSIYLIGINSVTATSWALERYNDGLGYDGKAWDKSEIIQAVKKIAPNTAIYTNNWEALYILADRIAQHNGMPEKFDLKSFKANKFYSDQIKKLKEDLHDQNGLIVRCALRNDFRRLPANDELPKGIPLKMLLKVSDGEIYAGNDQK